MNYSTAPKLALLALIAAQASAEVWTNALGNNDFANWANWVVDGTANNPFSWNSSTNNWQVNLSGADRAVVGPGQIILGVDRNILVGDSESAPLGVVGELLINGGTVGITRNLRLGRDTVTGSGTVTVDGGGLLEMGYGLYVGQTANAGSFFNLIDGTVNVTTQSNRSDGLFIGHREGGNGTLNISGGRMNVRRGAAEFSGDGNAGVATSALNLSGDGVLDVEAGNITFGGNAGGVTVAVSVADTAFLTANNVRFGEGADSDVTLQLSGGAIVSRGSVRVAFAADAVAAVNISGGLLDAATGFIGFGQGARADVTVTMSGGEIAADRMGFANNDTATAILNMTGGVINLARNTGTASHAGGLRMQSAGAALNIGGTAVVYAEKLYISDGGLLTLGGDAQINLAGSSDGTNPTFDFALAFVADDWSGVLGKIAFNGGSLVVAGSTDTFTPTDGLETVVNYADLLNAAIAEGVIYTDVAGGILEARYDANADVTELVLTSTEAPVVNIVIFREAGVLSLSIDGPAGLAVAIETSTDLTANSWTEVDVVTLGAEPTIWVDPNPAHAPNPRRFYRGRIGEVVLEAMGK